MPLIDGETQLLAIIGDPISQVRSPLIYNAHLARAGHNVVLVPWHAPAGHFEPIMAGLMRTANLAGIVVTYPFKQQALALADRVGAMAERVGAVNALHRDTDGQWTGDMFDGVGLIRAVASVGQSVAGRRVKLIGAGGAGSAIAFSVAAEGVASISIYDVDRGRASALAGKVATHYPACVIEAGGPWLGDADILINATPVGLGADDDCPIPLPALSAATTVVDIVPRAGGTRLLALAQERGCPHIGGAAMVEGQAEAVLEFFGLAVSTGLERSRQSRQA